MQVICKHYNTCSIKNTCSHAKEHEIVNNIEFTTYGKIIDADNCNNGKVGKCHCDSKFLRKLKIEKLNEKR